MITTKDFFELVPLFKSDDETRQCLTEPFWYDNHIIVTDGRIALMVYNENDGLPVVDGQYQCGSSLLREYMPKLDKLVASGVYLPFDCGMKTYSAASAALGDLIWDMDFLTSPIDDEYPDERNSEKDVHQNFAAVVLDCPPRPIVSAYYAALISRLVMLYPPAVAYSGASDPHGTIYIKGDNWLCLLMPRRVCAISTHPLEDNGFPPGFSVGDASTGTLIHRRGSVAVTFDDIRFPKAGA